MTIRAVLWDFGGVLTTSPFEAFNRFEAAHGYPKDFIRGVNSKDPQRNAWAQFESSRVTLDEFDGLFAAETKAAGHEIPGKSIINLLSGALRPRMVEVLKRCKQNYKVACLTNNVDAGRGAGMASSSEQADDVLAVMALFECVIESSKEGMRKPDPRIYQLACQRLDVLPEEVVYLDDLGINLKPARALGMTTIKVLDETQAIEELAQALAIEL